MLDTKKIGKKSIPPDIFPNIKSEALPINEINVLYCCKSTLYIDKKYSGDNLPVTGTNKYNKKIKKTPTTAIRFPFLLRLTIEKNKAP
ncbi:hypothetical protein OAS78_05650 [Pseudomonadales bacterium]|nr:hypothetical protein [Pseudomonadales bacterium]